MTYLVLSILFSVVTVSFFKLFERFGVQVFPAIVVNYFSCVLMGTFFGSHAVALTAFWQEPWFWLATILGVLFISIFYAIGQTSQRMGISVSMVAAKLSVVIPVSASVFLYNEPLTWIKLMGILLSLVAVVCISIKDGGKANHAQVWLLPIIVFVGSGLIDSLLNHANMQYIPPANEGSIITIVFLSAGFWGMLALAIGTLVGKAPTITRKDVIWGAALGVPNYFSMFFLLVTLSHFNEAALIFPINNIGIAGVSTLVSYMFFVERLSKLNLLGLGLAIVAILILSFS
jgi:drug/metabolite transporter (DMT)-like permease